VYEAHGAPEYSRPLAKVVLIKFWNGQDARSTKNIFSCGTGILPVLVIFARGLLMFCLKSEGCVLISINYEVNLKSRKNLQFAVFVSWFEEHLKRIAGVKFCLLPANSRQLELMSEQAS